MVRSHFNFDWSAAIQGWLQKNVEQSYRSDMHRWPTLLSFDATIYRCGPNARLFVVRDKPSASAIPSISGGNETIAWPNSLPNVINPFEETVLPDLLERVYAHFELRQQDFAIIIPDSEHSTIEEDFRSWTIEQEKAARWQLEFAMKRQLLYVRGFDQVGGGFFLPPGYEFLAKDCERFFQDHPRYEKNVFVMTRFVPGDKLLVALDVELRRVLRENDLDPVRADDKMYLSDRNLWNNVCVYMLCCSKGIAILEDRLVDEFNPNVALEYGFMRALNKPTMLLADVGFRNLRADVIGTLRETFDITDIKETIESPVSRWLRELN
ncbi:hypothetical protein AB0F15_01865 [Amycolatopsis sp. NPDC026612]|uniref:hypothetical protein n=1 Tax=Amycolatopsis sp. NPDC026612 TaxID=3155466 RepID=UPI0034006F27